MKKKLFCLFLTVISVSVVSAGDIRIGISGNYERYYRTETVDLMVEGTDYGGIGKEEETNRFRANIFLDVTYLLFAVGYLGLSNGVEEEWDLLGSESTELDKFSTGLTFSAYLKYPIEIKDLTLFPLVGGEYIMNLGYKDSEGNDAMESLSMLEIDSLNEIWLKAGLGLDIGLSENIFVRIICTGGYKVKSERDSVISEAYETIYGKDCYSVNTWAIETSLGLGFKLPR